MSRYISKTIIKRQLTFRGIERLSFPPTKKLSNESKFSLLLKMNNFLKKLNCNNRFCIFLKISILTSHN